MRCVCAGVFVYIYLCFVSVFLQLCCDAGLLHTRAGGNCGHICAEASGALIGIMSCLCRVSASSAVRICTQSPLSIGGNDALGEMAQFVFVVWLDPARPQLVGAKIGGRWPAAPFLNVIKVLVEVRRVK